MVSAGGNLQYISLHKAEPRKLRLSYKKEKGMGREERKEERQRERRKECQESTKECSALLSSENVRNVRNTKEHNGVFFSVPDDGRNKKKHT